MIAGERWMTECGVEIFASALYSSSTKTVIYVQYIMLQKYGETCHSDF